MQSSMSSAPTQISRDNAPETRGSKQLGRILLHESAETVPMKAAVMAARADKVVLILNE